MTEDEMTEEEISHVNKMIHACKEIGKLFPGMGIVLLIRDGDSVKCMNNLTQEGLAETLVLLQTDPESPLEVPNGTIN